MKWFGWSRACFAMILIFLLEGVAQGFATSEMHTSASSTTGLLEMFNKPADNLHRHIRSTSACPSDIDGILVNDLTRLQQAAASGNVDEVKHLVRDCKANVDAYGGIGSTAIHEAAFNGHADMISFLIQSGADPNKRKTESDGMTALHLAVLNQPLNPDPIPVVKALLDGGANPELKVQNPHYKVAAAQLALDQKLPQVKEFLDNYKPLEPMECVQNAMKQVTKKELQHVLQNTSPFSAFLEVFRGFLDNCRLQ